jgi:hypothetical protein
MNNKTSQTQSTRDYKSTQTTKTRQAQSSNHPVPTHDEIARRAYELYIMDGRQQDQCLQNWFEAERELSQQSEPESSPEQILSHPGTFNGSRQSERQFGQERPMKMDGSGPRRGSLSQLPQSKHGADA